MKGIFEILFPNMELTRNDSLLDGCKSCNYKLTIYFYIKANNNWLLLYE